MFPLFRYRQKQHQEKDVMINLFSVFLFVHVGSGMIAIGLAEWISMLIENEPASGGIPLAE